MKKKLVNINLILVQILFITLFGCDMFTTKSSKETISEGSTPENKVETLSYELNSFKKQSKTCAQKNEQCAEVAVQYPFFASPRGKFINAVIEKRTKEALYSVISQNEAPNISTEKLADLIIEDYHSLIDEFKETREKYDINYSVVNTFQKGNILSLSFNSEVYTGGAHANNTIDYVILDLNKKKILQLGDLVSDKSMLTKIAERLFRKQKNISQETNLQKEGYLFENGKFHLNENIGLNQNGMVVYFNSYEIAPYAMGPSAIFIPFYEIKNILKIKY